MSAIPSIWIVMRRNNGHVELPVGALAPSFSTEEDAKKAAHELSRKQTGQTFAWFRLEGQFQPREPIEEVRAA